MVDNGAAGDFTQYGSQLDASSFTLDVTGLTLTKQYRFYVIATNIIGSTHSNIVSAIVADPPATPTQAPSFDPT
jgi:hypothetical protein